MRISLLFLIILASIGITADIATFSGAMASFPADR